MLKSAPPDTGDKKSGNLDYAARNAKLIAELLISNEAVNQAQAQTLAAEEKVYREIEQHEKARLDREKAALQLAEARRNIELQIAHEKGKQGQENQHAVDQTHFKENELALQKELLYLDEREAEYESQKARYIKEGRAQEEAVLSTIRNQEKAYNATWLAAEKSYDKTWSESQSSYTPPKTAEGSGVFISDPANLAVLEEEMRSLANATAGIIPGSIQFNEATKELSFETQEAASSLGKYIISLNGLSGELIQTKDQSAQAASSVDSFFSGMSNTIKKFSSYLLSLDSLSKIWDVLKSGIKIVTEIDDAMTELKKVSNETALTYEQFQTQAAFAGQNVARTASDMIKASADWKKMGYNLQDALTLANASSLYVNVGDNVTMSDATSDIAATIKAFNLTANDAVGIVDRLNAVSNNYSVTSQDLGNILNHTSSSLAATNTSLDKTIALGAAMNEVFQDSAAAGSTLEVLSMRLRGARADLEATGKSTEGMAQSTSALREKIKELTDIDGSGGFDIMANDKTFKDVYEQIDGIAKKWKQMDDISRASLLELVAGTDQAQGVSALLNNWSEAEAILQTALTASGSAEKENELYLDSISGKITQLQAQYQELWQQTIDDDTIKFFIDLATNVLKLTTDIGGLVPVVTALGAALAGIKFAGKMIRIRDNECALLINAA